MPNAGFNAERDQIWREVAFEFLLGSSVWAAYSLPLWRAAKILSGVSEEAERRQDRIKADEEDRIAAGGEQEAIRTTQDWSLLMIDNGLITVSFMLIGLAIENMTKGLLISRDQNAFDANGEFKYKTHDLLYLFRLCNIPTNAEQKRILRELSEYVKWKGRYSIPLKRSASPQEEEMWALNREDFYIAEGLYDDFLRLYLDRPAVPSNLD